MWLHGLEGEMILHGENVMFLFGIDDLAHDLFQLIEWECFGFISHIDINSILFILFVWWPGERCLEVLAFAGGE
jgi:hypothetical protein